MSLARPLFLGIVNVTPDSFSDGGRFLDPGAAVARARALVDQGIQALDLGGESTRPGSAEVTPEQEWDRLEPVIARLRRDLPRIPLSLDTRHPEVAVRGLRAGVAVLNDVSGFRDPRMLRAARESGCGLIAMRSRMDGDRFVMPPYGDPAPDQPGTAVAELAEVRDRVLDAGIAPERILLDPGFGFALPGAGDRALWAALDRLPGLLDWPVERFCLGISRKRFMASRAGDPALPAPQRDPATAEAHREARDLGYRVFRTHQAQF